MHTETLWNGYVLHQPHDRFRLGTDSVVCAAFSGFPKGSRIADLGCGSGAIAMMLLASDPSFQLTGIELDEEAAKAAQKNAQQCPDHIAVIRGDLRQIRQLLPAGSMDCCISNPPYFPVGSGYESETMQNARGEDLCSLRDDYPDYIEVLEV